MEEGQILFQWLKEQRDYQVNLLINNPYNTKGQDISDFIRGSINNLEELLALPEVLKKADKLPERKQ
jgi:hypothetical protein